MTGHIKEIDTSYVTRMERMTPDEAAKRLFSHPEVFAEVFNYFFYQGRCVIMPEDLSPLPAESIIRKGVRADRRIRDILILNRAVIRENGECILVLLGIEHQSKADEFMIQRVINYNARSMLLQAEKAKPGEKLKPIITVVFYTGSSSWTYPVNLYSTLDIPEGIMPVMKLCEPDRIFLLVNPEGMSDEEIDRMGSVVSLVVRCLKYQNDPAKYENVLGSQRMERVPEDAFWAIKIFTNDDKLEYNSNGDETVDMCKGTNGIARKYEEEGKRNGLLEGTARAVSSIMAKLDISAAEAMNIADVPAEERSSVLSMLNTLN